MAAPGQATGGTGIAQFMAGKLEGQAEGTQ